MSDLTKYAQGKRMVREDQIKKIGENTAEIKKKVTSFKVDDITSISGEILSKMKAGDIVLKKTGEQYHTYVVSFKKDDEGICLTYTDASVVETVSYDLIDGTWTYNSTDTTELGGGTEVIANPTLAGTEADLEGLQVGETKYKVPQGSKYYIHKLLIAFTLAFTGDDSSTISALCRVQPYGISKNNTVINSISLLNDNKNNILMGPANTNYNNNDYLVDASLYSIAATNIKLIVKVYSISTKQILVNEIKTLESSDISQLGDSVSDL